jgi:spectinomycin phosphotransferase
MDEPVLDLQALTTLLSYRWRFSLSHLERLSVGFPGSHHFRVVTENTCWFVTVYDLSRDRRLAEDADTTFDALERAFGVAREAHENGLEFILAPEPNSIGEIISRMSVDHAVVVFPFIDGSSNPGGAHASPAERREVLQFLGRLHEAPLSSTARHDSLAIPHRDCLEDALDSLDRPWSAGPYSEPTRRLLADNQHDLRKLLTRYDTLANYAPTNPARWVTTHGEPHGANVHRATDGRLFLVDWDTALIAPPERDLWMVMRADDPEDLAAYGQHRGRYEIEPHLLALYRLWWDLAEIAEYVDRFRRPHNQSDLTRMRGRVSTTTCQFPITTVYSCEPRTARKHCGGRAPG